jgi:hypothetical protein
MACLTIRSHLTAAVARLSSAFAVILCASGPSIPTAHADAVAFLVNVTVRPGYSFPNADEALRYGYSICDKVSEGARYAQIMSQVRDDFTTPDEFQASYLINQAVNELCPQLIWQLRSSAAGYRPPAS